MTIPDKFSTVSQQQLDFFQQLTSRAFENAERILALNMATTRAALDQTSGAVRQLATARDPRDLLALTTQSQQQVEAAMAYSRKLFEITNQPAVAKAEAPAAAPAPEPASAPAPEDHIVTAAPVIVSAPVPEPASASASASASDAAPAAAHVQPSQHPLGEADPVPAPVVIAKAKPIAKAVSKVAAQPIDAPHPAASPMPPEGPVDIPAITPVDASAPPPAKRGSGAAAKGGRKR